jgi:wobble nucleotide-excising tRNase
MTVNLKIKAENIGPHSNLNGEINTGNCRAVIYANNGSGKTFLSRAFRVFEEKNTSHIDHLISFQKQKAKFELHITNGQSNLKSSFDVQKNNIPNINNDANYIYHVFNSDYVKENVAQNNFSPNKNIDGFILGKTRIDLSKEKNKLEGLNKLLTTKVNSLKIDKLPKAIQPLVDLGVNKNTTEYKALNYDNLIKGFGYIEKCTIQELKEEFIKLKSFDTTTPDLRHFNCGNLSNKLYTLLSEIKETLSKEVSTSILTDEFKKQIRNKHTFVKDGLKLLHDSDHCPFCQQKITNSAIDLIDKYKQFVNDEESKLLDKLGNLKNRLAEFGFEVRTSVGNCMQLFYEFDEIKDSIPSLRNENLSKFNAKDFDYSIELLEEKIITKIENISITDADIDITKLPSYTFISEFEVLSVAENSQIDKLNKAKNDIKTEKLNLNKRICMAVSLHLAKQCSADTNEITKLGKEIKELNVHIHELESNEKKSKKEAVANSFSDFLEEFFADKYKFDSKSSCLKYKNEFLQKNVNTVLSDGEKSIIAFCYFLAQTHELITKESDYERLFWIIDDPISSLDFHFVYAMAQIIRGLNGYFNLGNRFRYIIFTHNLEFLSVLSRNKICDSLYTLSSGKILKLSNKSVMPYEEHLIDIYNASKDEKTIKHTTPNSIRHVLETIQRFIAPEKHISEFCKDIPELKGNGFVYSLMQDLSHGIIRQNKPYTAEMVSNGCKAVISYIESNFKGQLKNTIGIY